MAERDYKVVYRSRHADDDYDARPSRRIPTALDPYDYPNDRDELKRNVAEAKLRSHHHHHRHGDLVEEDYALQPDDSISVRQEAVGDRILREKMESSPARRTEGTGAATGSVTTKTTYSVKKDGYGGDTRVTGAARSVVAGSPAGARERERDRDRDRDRVEQELSLSRYNTASSRDYETMEYDAEPLRRQNGAYVIETRRGDDVDVYVAGHRDKLREMESDRDFRDDGRYVQVYDDYTRSTPPVTRTKKYNRDGYAYDRRDEPRASARSFEVAEQGNPYASGAIIVDEPPSRFIRQEIPRSTARVIEEDDWKLVDSRRSSSSQPSMFRDPFHENRPIDSRGRTRGRSFAQQASDDDYVVVTPPRGKTEHTSGTIRSAMAREDTYTPEERHRRRSRSAHFRDGDIPRHTVGEQKHERPGAEAEMMGRYLRRYDPYEERDERVEYDYSERNSGRRARSRDAGARGARYVVADGGRGYGPQRDNPPSSRRKDHYGGRDDTSYYSDHYEKTKYYR